MEDNNYPLVSVGIPTFDRPAGLKKCLDYATKQDYPNLEFIISDNCSTDPEVQKIIAEFSTIDNRINGFKQNHNIGLEANFNFVQAKSKGEYFIWMSDDDFFDANYISECIKVLSTNPHYMLCSGVAQYYLQGTYTLTEKMFKVNQKNSFSRIIHYFAKVNKNGNFYGVFRNNLISEAPIGLHIGCDWSFMAKLAHLGKLTYTSTTNYHRSIEGNSQTKAKMIRKFKLNKFQALFFETYAAYTVCINLFRSVTFKQKNNLFKRFTICSIAFILINIRSITNFVQRKFKVRG